jgi:hypothetical protein
MFHIVSLCVCFCAQISHFYKNISHIGLGPTLTWLHFHHPISKCGHFLRYCSVPDIILSGLTWLGNIPGSNSTDVTVVDEEKDPGLA